MNKIKEKGITLIALVITIITLLILSGVSISMLTGENGIIIKANNAKIETEKASIKEAVEIGVLGSFENDGKYNKDLAKKYIDENLKIETTQNQDGSINISNKGVELVVTNKGKIEEKLRILEKNEIPEYLKNNQNIKEVREGNVPIPKGFSYLHGLIDSGVVVSDEKGNEFVWIPVDRTTFNKKFKRIQGYISENLNLDSRFNYIGEANSQGINEKLEEYTNKTVSESPKTKEEAIAMYKSVQGNGGFYIGRYEAGVEQERNENLVTLSEVIVKKNKPVYNIISWSEKDEMNMDGGGAVEVSRGMYNNKNYGVTSTLCYGVQWDAMLNYIDPNFITNEKKEGVPNCSKDSVIVNIEGKGNKIGIINTGSKDEYCIKNIYDIIGNANEWTMETYSNSYRVYRGRT